jgi:hypothetical protein
VEERGLGRLAPDLGAALGGRTRGGVHRRWAERRKARASGFDPGCESKEEFLETGAIAIEGLRGSGLDLGDDQIVGPGSPGSERPSLHGSAAPTPFGVKDSETLCPMFRMPVKNAEDPVSWLGFKRE